MRLVGFVSIVLSLLFFHNKSIVYEAWCHPSNEKHVHQPSPVQTVHTQQTDCSRLVILWQFIRHKRFYDLYLFTLCTTVSYINRFFMMLEDFFMPQLQKIPMDRVVFILGHPRSGTTNLQNALNTHPTCTSGDMIDLIFPSLILNNIIRHKIMRPLLNYFNSLTLTYDTPNHSCHIHEKIEEHFWLCHRTISHDLLFIFPNLFSYCPKQFHKNMEFTHQDFDFIKKCLQRILYAQKMQNKTLYIAKPLSFTCDAKALKQHFPDSKIILCVRHPREAIPSYVTLLTKILALKKDDPLLEAIITHRYTSFMVPCYQQMLWMTSIDVHKSVEKSSIFFVDFQELVSRPKDVLHHLQIFLNLPVVTLTLSRSETHKRTDPNALFIITPQTIEQDCQVIYTKILKNIRAKNNKKINLH